MRTGLSHQQPYPHRTPRCHRTPGKFRKNSELIYELPQTCHIKALLLFNTVYFIQGKAGKAGAKGERGPQGMKGLEGQKGAPGDIGTVPTSLLKVLT